MILSESYKKKQILFNEKIDAKDKNLHSKDHSSFSGVSGSLFVKDFSTANKDKGLGGLLKNSTHQVSSMKDFNKFYSLP